MPRLSRAIVEYIVTEAVAAQTSLNHGQIQAPLSINALGLDSAKKQQIQEQIVRAVDSIGFRSTFSIDAFSDAQTVGDLIDLALAATDGGWPR